MVSSRRSGDSSVARTSTIGRLIHFDFVNTLAAAGLVLFAGYAIQRRVGLLSRHNIPAPVVGGLLVAIAVTGLRAAGYDAVRFDKTLEPPLMIAFFTSIGFGASVPLLRAGGPAVALFLALSTAVAVLQNLVGAGVAWGLGVPPLLGVLAGSVTLTGGPATGLAFAPQFEEAGVTGAAALAVAAAMVGIVSGGMVGGPIGTRLLTRTGLRPSARGAATDAAAGGSAGDLILSREAQDAPPPVVAGDDPGAHAILKGVVSLLAAMALGAWISAWKLAASQRLGAWVAALVLVLAVLALAFVPRLARTPRLLGLPRFVWATLAVAAAVLLVFKASALTLPAYIGAMLAAAALRNLDDVTGWIRLPHRLLDDLGNAALALFIAMALMTLKLWEIANLALPLAVILLVQVTLVALVALYLVAPVMGRDYDAAVMASGFVGFMLGTTANAMANMGVLVEKYGPAPRAYLVVPMVGAFFIDFTNAIIITAFLNLWK